LRILEQRFEIIDGVEDTLAALRPHHDLFLLTKGHDEEQRIKVERSGIDSYFDAVLITDEKDEHTYRSTVDTLDLDPDQTWMIGNSPRSDINPAMRAGLNAVFIPHSRTWHLEVEEFAIEGSGGRLIQLATFRELTTIFASG
jgi:putative hydrolase of the HAD superfamily